MWQGISVVIPVYNSSNSLEELYQRLSRVLKRISHDYEIIMVDDGSRDMSYNIMLRLHRNDHRVKAIRLDRNYGQQNALFCGFHFVNYRYTVTLDDDLQHLPEEIEKMILALDKGHDIIFGIPELKHHCFYRQIGSKLTDYLFNKITSKPESIRISSFRVIKRELIEKILTHKKAFIYISASAFKYTVNAGNVKVKHSSRLYGNSNYSFFKLVKLFLMLYVYYGKSPLTRVFSSSQPPYRIKETAL